MATKGEELQNGDGCLHKAADDEVIFVLRAKDPIAPLAVRAWADYANLFGAHEAEKIEEAKKVADQMEAWRGAKESGK